MPTTPQKSELCPYPLGRYNVLCRCGADHVMVPTVFWCKCGRLARFERPDCDIRIAPDKTISEREGLR